MKRRKDGCSEKEMFNIIFEGTYRDERWGFRRNRYVSLFVDSFIFCTMNNSCIFIHR